MLKRLLISLLFGAVFFIYSPAQTRDSTIIITTQDGRIYGGVIVKDERDVYLQLLATDKTTYTFSYGMLKEIKNKNGEIIFSQPVIADTKPVDQRFTDDPQYSSWQTGWLITGKDTTPVRVDPRDDYTMPEVYGISSIDVKMVFKNDSMVELRPEEIPELVLFNEQDTTRYISLQDSFSNELFLVVVDGRCKLLWDGMDNDLGAEIGSIVAGWLGSMIGNALSPPKGRYYIFYEETLLPCENRYRRKIWRLFSECPDLQAKINGGTYTMSQMKNILRDFNRCIDNNR